MARPCHRTLSANAAMTAPIIVTARASKNQARSAQVNVTVTSFKEVASPDVTTTVSGPQPWSTTNLAERVPLAASRHTSAVLISVSAPAPEERRSSVSAGKCTALTVDTADVARIARASVLGAAVRRTAPPSRRVAVTRTGTSTALSTSDVTAMEPGAFKVTLKCASPEGPSLTTIQAPTTTRMMPIPATTAPRARRADAGTVCPHLDEWASRRHAHPRAVEIHHDTSRSRRTKDNRQAGRFRRTSSGGPAQAEQFTGGPARTAPAPDRHPRRRARRCRSRPTWPLPEPRRAWQGPCSPRSPRPRPDGGPPQSRWPRHGSPGGRSAWPPAPPRPRG